MARLAGRAAIITGAASGIGRASAELFAEEGARVLAVDRPRTNLTFNARGIEPHEADIGRKGVAEEIVRKAVFLFDGLDILFSNAGIGLNAAVREMRDEDWALVQSVNIDAGFRLARESIPHLVASTRGRMIFTASVMALGTDYGLGAYCASKAAVLGLTRTLALELGRAGVTANAILPGAIKTGMTARAFEDEKIAEVWARKSVLKRLGEPIDVARLALFLASEDASFVTGQAIAVDGGMMLRI
ncbi:MAG: SDR family NAD(P)-dependent oxidoreductase [Caulobacteraceae bacterium]